MAGPAAAARPALPGAGRLVLLLTIWLSWGLAWPVMGLALHVVDPLTQRAFVMIVGGASMLGGAWLGGSRIAIPRGQLRDLVICGLLNMTVCQLAMTYGVWYVGAGRSAVLLYTMPLWAAVGAWAILGERLTWRRIVALLLGIASVVALLAQALPQVRNAPLGVAVNLVGAVAFGFGTVWTKRTVWQLDPMAVAGWQFLLAFVPVLPLWILFHPPLDWGAIGPVTWIQLGFLGVIANGVAYAAWFRLVRGLPAAVAGIGSLVVPCVGVLSSTVLLGETIHLNDALALGLVCAAVGLVLFEPKRAG